ncbi:hypothetical protein RvY_06655 [Ramazzottius varieornatus]|uniref:Chitin-binding type-2 domain-containing protein n=1 Tax=Ramazzottius varieornatus TaxID=947166 RepID=A0A1D1UZB4_RAMVA|nr:hypothetical protein RvY_06655 [Ramazzottius varieornatus]
MKFLVVLALVGFAAAQQNKYSGRYVFDLIKPALTAGEVETLLASRDASYPTYNEIPQTSFQCGTRIGFYADVEAQCQVFHRCDINGNQTSYLCVNTTVFNQITLVCDAWYNVDCAGSAQYEDFANSRLYTGQQLFDSPPADYIAPSQLLAQQQQEQLNAQGSQSSGQQQGGQQSGNQQASGSRGGASQASRGNANTQAGRPAVNANAGAQAGRSNKGSMTLQSSGFASSAGRSDTTQEQGADQTQSGAEQTQGADQTFKAQGRSDTEQGQSQQAQGADQSNSASQSASAEERSDAAEPSTAAAAAESSPADSADQSSNAGSAAQSSSTAARSQ